jgi:hypothetical protein
MGVLNIGFLNSIIFSVIGLFSGFIYSCKQVFTVSGLIVVGFYGEDLYSYFLGLTPEMKELFLQLTLKLLACASLAYWALMELLGGDIKRRGSIAMNNGLGLLDRELELLTSLLSSIFYELGRLLNIWIKLTVGVVIALLSIALMEGDVISQLDKISLFSGIRAVLLFGLLISVCVYPIDLIYRIIGLLSELKDNYLEGSASKSITASSTSDLK